MTSRIIIFSPPFAERRTMRAAKLNLSSASISSSGSGNFVLILDFSQILDPGLFFKNPNTFQFLILDLFLDLGTFLHPRSSIYLVSWILELSSIMDMGPFLLCSIQFNSTAVFTCKNTFRTKIKDKKMREVTI